MSVQDDEREDHVAGTPGRRRTRRPRDKSNDEHEQLCKQKHSETNHTRRTTLTATHKHTTTTTTNICTTTTTAAAANGL